MSKRKKKKKKKGKNKVLETIVFATAVLNLIYSVVELLRLLNLLHWVPPGRLPQLPLYKIYQQTFKKSISKGEQYESCIFNFPDIIWSIRDHLYIEIVEEPKMIVYKNILGKLADAGYNTTRIRREKILSESTLTQLRNNKRISTDTLDTVCRLTGLPVEDLIEYRQDTE